MNQQERDALREKHQRVATRDMTGRKEWCNCCGSLWPCDIIKVLHAHESFINHLVDCGMVYCPICGEEL
jgi:hypothetical protein